MLLSALEVSLPIIQDHPLGVPVRVPVRDMELN